MSRRICVYCGSRSPNNPELSALAVSLGKFIAQRKWGLVYGGGKVGMMGTVANACLEEGGEVIGIIPTALKRAEVAHTGITKLIETPDMHSRKAKMEELSDAFVVLPGGFGTLDEFFEILTWKQLGFHYKPIALVNHTGYFEGLNRFVDTAIETNFIRNENQSLFSIISSFEELMEFLDEELSFRTS